MSATVDFVPKAIERVQQAVALDTEAGKIEDPEKQREKYEEALNCYVKAVEAFRTAIKWEKLKAKKEMLSNKCLEYVDRAEAIKTILAEPIKPKKEKVAAGGSGDKDKEKMRQTMQDAIVQEKPNVKWEDIAGLDAAKEALKEAVILPIKFPQLFSGAGRAPWSGIMLYGPPGTGKSYLAKAVATEADATFLSVSSADLTSKWLGESEKLVKILFESAREQRPSIIFIDEIDSIATARSDSESESSRRIKTELLVQMDGLGNTMEGLLVLVATNLPWAIDSAVRRRCQKRIYIPLPDERARRRMFEIHMSKINPPPDVSDDQMRELAGKTEGFSGSDMTIMVRDAVMEPVRRCQDAQAFMWVKHTDPESGEEQDRLMPCSPGAPEALQMTIMQLATDHGAEKLIAPPVNYRDFEKTLQRCKPSVSEADLAEFEEFTKNFGQEG